MQNLSICAIYEETFRLKPADSLVLVDVYQLRDIGPLESA